MGVTEKGAWPRMGSRRMQIVGIVLAVLMAALLAVTLWAYRPVSLAEAADARTGLEPKVAVVETFYP